MMMGAEHRITLRTPMSVRLDNGQSLMAKILYASRLTGGGDQVSITLTGVSEGTSEGSPRFTATSGVAIPLNNIAGWQTEAL